MDARQYLSSRGWKGDGHGLGSTHSGIKRPLLVSKKVDVLGIGINKHTAVSDQWWLRAFDQGLKDLGTGKEGALAQVQKHGHARGGLYGRFVRGERLEGSISATPDDSGTSTPDEMAQTVKDVGGDQIKSSMKRKRGAGSEENMSQRKTSKVERTETGPQEHAAEAATSLTVEELDGRDMKAKLERRIKSCTDEAFRRGIIPAGPKEIQQGKCPRDGVQPPPLAMGDPFRAILDHVAKTVPCKAGMSDKAAKITREKAKRELKRVAKEMLSSGGNDVKQEKAERAEKSRKKKEEKEISKADLTEARMERTKQKRAAKAAKLAQMRLDNAIDDLDLPSKEQKDAFGGNADEIKFGATKKGRVKSIPGIGPVEKYPTKAEKKARKQAVEKLAGGKIGAKRMGKLQKEAGTKDMALVQSHLQDKQLRKAQKKALKDAGAAQSNGADEPLGFVVDTAGFDETDKSLKKTEKKAQKAAREAAKKAASNDGGEAGGFIVDTTGDTAGAEVKQRGSKKAQKAKKAARRVARKSTRGKVRKNSAPKAA